ncbi:MAG TPA: hypothetical protein VD931_12735 [Baekduia sp.]|nr:hypothetical protein [Baekduia sp.]
MRRLLAVVLVAVAACAATGAGALPATASPTTVRVGVADNFPWTFTDPGFLRLGVKRTRYVVQWNLVDDPERLLGADQFLEAARRAGVEVLLHFSTDDYTPRAARLPSRLEYRQKVGALVARYWGYGVRHFGVWNEANDRTQPTYQSPERAAEFFQELWRMLQVPGRCGPRMAGCRVVALDVLDGRSKKQLKAVRAYIRRFYKRLGRTYRERARIVGLHNYSDTNRNSSGGTRNALREVQRHTRRPRIWLTETGGVLKIGDTGDFRCFADDPLSVQAAEQRAAGAVRWMFKLATRFRKSVDRLYVYQYTGADCRERFDAGLVRRDRSRRPAWYEVDHHLRASELLKP